MAATIDNKLNSIVEVLKPEHTPIRLFLFGSRAGGNPHIDSDYDFVMIVQNDNFSRHRSMSKARGLLHEKCQISADVFFYSQEEFEDWKDELNSIPETALNTGIEIKLR